MQGACSENHGGHLLKGTAGYPGYNLLTAKTITSTTNLNTLLADKENVMAIHNAVD